MVEPTLTRARVATSALLFTNGFVLGAWIVHIPAIMDRTDISAATLGTLLLWMGVCAWIAMQAAGFFVDRTGSARAVVVSLLVMCLAITLPSLATNVWTLAAGLGILGAANGIVDVSQNAQAVTVERAFGRPIMSSFHAYFSAGGLAASVLGGGMLALGWPVPLDFLVFAVIGLALVAAVRPHLLDHDVRDREDRPGRPPWTLQIVLLGALAFALMLAEGVAYDWSTVHLRDELGTSEALAAVAYGAFSLTMFISRLVVDRIVAVTGAGTFVRWASLLGACGLAIAIVAPVPAIAIAGWAVVGIGLAGCVPQFFSAAGNVDPRHGAAIIARVTGMGYVALLSGPSVIGLLTHWVPLTTAFLVPLALCLVASALAPRALGSHR
ncbi:MFS transporter [Aeromicrobium duanguangcaii]|uniref:MFS transporter n=1 Tax=Aeromicrobium duanguangcaii TaxID=2968086 RepID=A0ABY5KEE0_9ACTN|nr:MFS transporter [Aeromicrobium duanguangcaii]MCD9155201.1 MFS transporter [Aeromicrobium duanguangcaii]UUI68148.1 MFS transporter [Aeromicrobium duanguangcaii]